MTSENKKDVHVMHGGLHVLSFTVFPFRLFEDNKRVFPLRLSCDSEIETTIGVYNIYRNAQRSAAVVETGLNRPVFVCSGDCAVSALYEMTDPS